MQQPLKEKKKKCIFNSAFFDITAALAKQSISYNLAASRWVVNVFIPPVSCANEFINSEKQLEIWLIPSEHQHVVSFFFAAWLTLRC